MSNAGIIRAAALLLGTLSACAPPQESNSAGLPGSGPLVQDTARTKIPVGYGSLRQDDIAIRMQPQGLVVRAIPLDESVIRLLTVDSYRALRDLQISNRRMVADVSRRLGGRAPALWYVSFYGLQPDARFSPMELVITSGGRDFRPIDVIPLTTGFGEQRLRQRETQSAVFLYADDIDLDHPLTVTFQGERNVAWEQILQRIERERALVRARSSR